MEKLEALQKAKAALTGRDWSSAVTSGLKVLGDQFVECLCNYGESVWRVLFWIAALLFVIGPSLVFVLGKLDWTGNSAQAVDSLASSILKEIYSYFQYLIYILDAFTTASFSQLVPKTNAVRLASGLIAFSGIVLAGLLGFVAGNKIRRL